MEQNTFHLSITNQSGLSHNIDAARLESLYLLMSDEEKVTLHFIEIVLITEEMIVQINKEFLGKDYITDIITFPYHEDGEPIEGTLFCCLPRIYDQAKEFLTTETDELYRICIHGLLHLVGYTDTSGPEKKRMTHKENEYLERLKDL
ncbi:MAG: rRNA maturation RNase YbeY [Balneolales bacterium]|nr:rRNA maturation RNase YbeY [Balneolales bacterium]